MVLKVCKEFVFDAAHHLPGYNGLCANLHGHQWKLEVEVIGEVDHSSGMVMDFSVLKKIVNEAVVRKFDHTLINDCLTMPTAENMVTYIVGVLGDYFTTNVQGLSLSRIRLYETPTSFAEWGVGCSCGH